MPGFERLVVINWVGAVPRSGADGAIRTDGRKENEWDEAVDLLGLRKTKCKSWSSSSLYRQMRDKGGTGNDAVGEILEPRYVCITLAQ
jgi:hypothetical protein